MSSGKWRFVDNMQFSVPCQNDVVNDQSVSPLGWNNSLLKTVLAESQIPMIFRLLVAQEKHFLDVQGVDNMQYQVNNNLLQKYTYFFNLILKGTFIVISKVCYIFLSMK